MGDESIARGSSQAAGMGIGEALEGSDAQKAEALWAVVRNHEDCGELPKGVGIGQVARAALGMDWEHDGEALVNVSAEEVSCTLFNMKLRLFALLDAQSRTGESACILRIFCGEDAMMDAANVSFARGILVSAFGAGQCSREAIEAAGNFVRSPAVSREDKETMLETLRQMQEMGVDLSAAKGALEQISGERGGRRKRSKVENLAGALLLEIENGQGRGFRGLERRSWMPWGRRASGETGKAPGKPKGGREPTGKTKT